MDNRYFSYGCPAIKSDARGLTNYYPTRTFNQFIRTVNKLGSAQDYKNFLQNNGQFIMHNEMKYIVSNNTCNVDGHCVQPSSIQQPNTGFEGFTNCGCGKK
jgi:hypothetical protein